jgi:hypothetical protein
MGNIANTAQRVIMVMLLITDVSFVIVINSVQTIRFDIVIGILDSVHVSKMLLDKTVVFALKITGELRVEKVATHASATKSDHLKNNVIFITESVCVNKDLVDDNVISANRIIGAIRTKNVIIVNVTYTDQLINNVIAKRENVFADLVWVVINVKFVQEDIMDKHRIANAVANVSITGI